MCGDKSYITECGIDVVYQASCGNGVMYCSQLKHVFLGTYNITVMTYSGLIKHKSLSVSRSTNVF